MKTFKHVLPLFTILLPISLWAATITGKVTNSSGGAAIAGAKVVLKVNGVSVDSTTTSSTGTYTLTTTSTRNLQVVVTAAGFATRTRSVETEGNQTTITQNVSLTATSGLLVSTHKMKDNIHFIQIGKNLVVELGVSKSTRVLEVFGLNGLLLHKSAIPAGQSRVEISADLSPKNGFLFQVK